jgi:formylglycine-generating enzyme required for sulfatase activity
MNRKVVLWSSLFVMLSVVVWAQTGSVSGGFVKVPTGTFMMGSPASEAERQTREGPQRRVTLSAFYIGRCFAIFHALMERAS